MKILTTLHQIFHVIDVWKEEFVQLKELWLGFWQLPVGEKLEKVTKVVPTTKKQLTNFTSALFLDEKPIMFLFFVLSVGRVPYNAGNTAGFFHRSIVRLDVQ